MQKETDHALNALEEQKKVTEQKHTSSQQEQKTWTARAKKNAIFNYEEDGKKHRVPIMIHLRRVSMKLPPVYQNGRRMVHFDELRWRFMKGASKQESMQLVNQYCNDVIDSYNRAVEEYNKSKEPQKTESNVQR